MLGEESERKYEDIIQYPWRCLIYDTVLLHKKALNIIGADFLSSSDKKTFDDLIHEYFDPGSKSVS